MQVIQSASENILKILGKPKISDDSYRLMCYAISANAEDGVLLFNTLTRELLLLTNEEYERADALPELREKWFTVPRSLSDKTYADRAKFVLKATAKKPEHITSFTIFTTTDCNARCFYCYEKGCSRVPMSEETAHRAAKYIAERCGGERVSLTWFGGEPLYNKPVIDLICSDLSERGIEYVSFMLSNGYLFDDETVKKASEFWNLKKVQITMDGTEEVYNRVKAYIYRDGNSPYRIVMENIGRLLDHGIEVSLRMNMDRHNADDLMRLADELHERFGGRKGFTAYSHVLFEFVGKTEHVREAEERKRLYHRQQKLRGRLAEYGLCLMRGLSRTLPVTRCTADSGEALTILPDGRLGLCDNYVEDNFVGRLEDEMPDADAVQRFRETREPIEACAECFYYPECIRLKMCAETKECFPELREENLQSLIGSMRTAYAAWLEKKEPEEAEQSPTC